MGRRQDGTKRNSGDTPAKDDTVTNQASGDRNNKRYCSFGGKAQHEVRKQIASAKVFMCDEGVEL